VNQENYLILVLKQEEFAKNEGESWSRMELFAGLSAVKPDLIVSFAYVK